MSLRTFLLLVLIFPALLIGAAIAADVTIPIPEWGRDYVQRVSLQGEVAPAGLPEVLGPDDVTRPLVVIDAGHGGRDPGAVGQTPDGETVREKEVTLAIALALRDELLAAGGIRVALTRSGDYILPLGDRPEIARQLGADLFISIHADSAGGTTDVSGASIYTLSSEASSEAAALFAARENDADRVNGIEIEGQSEQVSAILVELSQQATQEESAELSSLIIREGDGEIAFVNQPRRSGALVVLRAPDLPSVLFESGFVTNQADRARLSTAEGRATYARVLARAIEVYFARRADR
ncbi:MAG: N-acetylmuramoyl-L-alanine amidase [Pseudomonadota bacterium]